jgi:type IV pilus assembly protein PilQ
VRPAVSHWIKNTQLFSGLTLGLAALLLLPAPAVVAQDACYSRLSTELVSLNLRDANVQTTLRLLAQHYRVNMVVTDEVAGSVTLDFYRVPVRDVFQTIIESANLQCIEQGVALRVSTAERIQREEAARAGASVAGKVREAELKTKEADARVKIREAEAKDREAELIKERGQVKEEMIKLQYADAEVAATTIRSILGLRAGAGATGPQVLPPQFQPAPPVTITNREPGAPGLAPPTFEGPGPAAGRDVLAYGLAVEAFKPTNSIFIRYFENDLERLKKLIKEKIDIPLPQVHIAAQMVITTQNSLMQIGIQWGGALIRQPVAGLDPALLGSGFGPGIATGGGTPVRGTYTQNPGFTGSTLLPISPTTGQPVGGNLVNLPTSTLPTLATPALNALFGVVARDYNLNLALQALEAQGKAKILAEPKIVTVENVPALIQRGFEVPFATGTAALGTQQVQFKDALLQLQVTPNVVREDNETKIRMKVAVNNDEPDFTKVLPGTTNPPLFKRRVETQVIVREGERLVIGGVLTDNNSRTVRQVPLLGSIPILGWLFKNREISTDTQDLIVIITPTVVDSKAPVGR